MLYETTSNFPNKVMHESEGSLISPYQPTYRHRLENVQDIIRFKNLMQKIRNSLDKKDSQNGMGLLLKPFNAILEDRLFWNRTKGRLGVLANKNRAVVYRLSRPVKEIALLADSFHIKDW